MSDTPKQNILQEELEKKIAEIAVQKEEEETKAFAQRSGLPYVNLSKIAINPSSLIILDEETARNGNVAIILKSGKTLKIAVLDPENQQTKSSVERLRQEGYECSLVIVSQRSLLKAWEKYKIEKKSSAEKVGVVAITEEEISQIQNEIRNINDLQEKIKKMSTTQVVHVLIAGALKIGASDIHLEPEETSVRLRYRMDGVLQDILYINRDEYPNILSRIKLTSGVKINIHNKAQDGRFSIKQGGDEIEIRTSILPGAYGENIVMRVLDPTRIKQKVEELGMREDTLELVRNLLRKNTGAIITTGPTGSGKTTTLYAFINQVNTPDIKIITIEDPIEYHIEGISQTQVDAAAGYDFANGLRSIVRQDPDVILVGEIRDAETADIAMQASLTGHLVFTTLHTNDAAGAIPRLIDFGIKPITIAPAINAAMAQRLVRRLCQKCRRLEQIKPEDFAMLQKHLQNLPPTIKLSTIEASMKLYYPQQCEECNMTGYKDRIGVYEIFVIDNELEKVVITSPSITEIKNLAIKKGLISMIQDGLIKVTQGLTSVEEVMRVIGE